MKNESNSNLSRRSFIRRAASGTAMITLAPVAGLTANDFKAVKLWAEDAAEFSFHMIGHAHIDPVWLWSWSEGVAVVHSTFQSALDRMNESSDFCFTASSAQFYQWVAENDPEMLAEIRKRVDEGRWNIVGGWWVEPDMNIPSGESMVRQGLYGQLTFQKLLGHRAKVATNPDSFGHANTVPQIIQSQGMKNYIFMRPQRHEKEIPADLFWWEGADGTRVLTYRIQYSYNNTRQVKERIDQTLKEYKDQPMKSFLSYYGAGDHGGGATKLNIQSINELKSDEGAPQVFFSTTDRYFNEMRADKSLNLPVVNDDLQHHAVGCYTVESAIKKGNRQSETALVTAEKISALGSRVWGANYPKKELTTAWQRVLFLQFHDSSAGTSLVEHSQDAKEGYGFALDVAHQATMMAIQKLEWQIPSEDPDSHYIVVFNPHGWEVTGNVEYDYNWGDNHKSSRVEDENGNPLPHQWTIGSSQTGSRKKLVIQATIPPFGYRQIRLSEGESTEIKSKATAKGNKLENDYLRVQFSKNGTIGIFDKETNQELFSETNAGCKAVIIDDPSDTWSHSVQSFSDEIGAFENASVKVLENGPLRAITRVISTYGASTLTIDWILYSVSRNLEAKVSLDWHEKHKMLKFSFPVNVESPVATYETPYGTIERATNGDEDPGQRWIDVSGVCKGQMCGLTVINDAKYGYNVIDNDMRISIVRAPVFAHHRPKVLDKNKEYVWMDQGIQTFRLKLVPHKNTWKESNIVKIAEEFSAPLVPIYQGIHGGSRPKSDSLLALNSKNVIISAMKESEFEEDLIVRCVETLGSSSEATIDFKFINRKWTGIFQPYEIKTLRVEKMSGNIKEVNLLEE